MWNLLNVRLFTGICKLCRNDHLAVVRVVNIGEDSFMVQSEEPPVTQSEEPAVTQSEEPAVTPSEELAIAQSEELSRTTEAIPEILPSQPHASSDSGSQLEVCFTLLLCR